RGLQRRRAPLVRRSLPRKGKVGDRNRCRRRQVCDQGVQRSRAAVRCHAPQRSLRHRRREPEAGPGQAESPCRRSVQAARAGAERLVSKFKFLRKRSDYYRHFTVLDIGTDLIKVLVVRREGPDGEVLRVGREPQAPAAMSGGAIADLDSVIKACNRALEAAEDMARTVPGQVVVGIAGELIKGFSSTIAYPRENSKSRVRSGEMSTMLQM